MKTGFYLLELTHREFPVSLTGFGFAVYVLEKMASTLVLSQNDDFDYKFKFEDNAMQLSLQYCKGFIWVI